MRLRVELVDPLDVVDEAASVLQDAWSPPCVLYDASYLEWQFSFPSRLPRAAAVARTADSTVGFAATTTRVARIGTWVGEVAVVSFVAVRPNWRGQRIADRLYDVLLGELRGREHPVLTFGEPGTAGERALVSAYSRAGFARHALGTCEPFGCVSRAPSERARIVDLETLADCDTWSEAAVRLSTDAQQLRHFGSDPRWRRGVIVDGEPPVAAMAVAAPMMTAKGVETVLAIDVAFAPFDAAESLRAAADALATAYTTKPGATIVFHNAPLRDTARARAAGLRKLPARFAAHLCLPPHHDALNATALSGTNVDVV